MVGKEEKTHDNEMMLLKLSMQRRAKHTEMKPTLLRFIKVYVTQSV